MSGQHHMNSSCPLQCLWPCKQQGSAHTFSNILEHTAIQCVLDFLTNMQEAAGQIMERNDFQHTS